MNYDEGHVPTDEELDEMRAEKARLERGPESGYYPAYQYWRIKTAAGRYYWGLKRRDYKIAGTISFFLCDKNGNEPLTPHMISGLPEDFAWIKRAEEDKKYGGLKAVNNGRRL